LNTLANIVYDQLNNEYSPEYILQLLAHDAQSPQLSVALRTRFLLEPVKKILEVLVNGASACDGDFFNRAESAAINHARQSLKTNLDILRASPGGLEAFQGANVRNNAVCDIALTVLNQLFNDMSDIRNQIAYTGDHEYVVRGHFGWVWVREIIQVILIEDGRYDDHNLRPIFHDIAETLEPMAVPFETLIQHASNEPDSLKRLSCEQLEKIQDLLDRGNTDGVNSPLRPVFATRWEYLEVFVDNSGGRLVKPLNDPDDDGNEEDGDGWAA
jgi:hypothetical protein